MRFAAPASNDAIGNSSLANVLSSLILQLRRPFHRGDQAARAPSST